MLAECHLPEEPLQFIVSPDDQLQSFPPGKGLEGAQAPFKFLIGLDVGIVKETVNLPARVAQLAERVNGARCATDVQKDLRQGLLSPCNSAGFQLQLDSAGLRYQVGACERANFEPLTPHP